MVKGPEESNKLIYAETKFAMFVVKNNFPFSICDEFSKIVSGMFAESNLAKIMKLESQNFTNHKKVKGRLKIC